MRNLIILCLDQLRYDATGFGGNPDVKTPAMDALAARGVTFDNSFATFPKCVPARCSLMTGKYCHVEGWRSVSQTLDPATPDLLQRLTGLGYQTAVFGKNHCWDEARWDGLDFSSYKPPMDRHERPPQPKSEPGRFAPLELDNGWDYKGTLTRHMSDERFAAQAVDFLTSARDKTRPFFMQLNFEAPHSYYAVEEPYFSMYDRDGIRPYPTDLPKNAPLSVTAQREIRTGMKPNPRAAREIQATYYGMVSKVDALLGRVLAAMDDEDVWKDTVVLLWSDHGDYAGQYQLVEKWDTHFADCLMRVATAIAAPGLPAGKRIGHLCDTTDLMPTLCQLMAVEPPPGGQGRSLLPTLEGMPVRQAVFADGGHEPEMRQRFHDRGKPVGKDGEKLGKSETYWAHPDSMARGQMVRTATHKLVMREAGGNELYDLAADPWELNNRFGDASLAPVQADLLQRLAEWNLQTLRPEPYLDNFTV